MFVNEKYSLHYKVSLYFSLNIMKPEEVIILPLGNGNRQKS